MDEKELIETITKHDEQIKSMEKRIEACEETTTAINSLTKSIVKMDVTLENTNNVVKELKSDVNDLKGEPRKRWNAVILSIITGVGGALATAIIGAIALFL